MVAGSGKKSDGLFRGTSGFFDRAGIYLENNISYADNAERFIFFSKCVANLARYLPWKPDMVHVHDWQTALVPALMLHQKRAEGWWNPPPTCLTIHNLAYQGIFPPDAFALTNLPSEFFTMDGAEFYGQLNCLKAGIIFADAITTVSPRYAREITTEELGCALDDRLRQRQNRLFGILNGVDYEEWNTTENPFLPNPYSATRLAGKTRTNSRCKKNSACGCQKDAVVRHDFAAGGTKGRGHRTGRAGGNVERGHPVCLARQRFAGLRARLSGTGAAFSTQGRRPCGYDEGLSHRIEAGCDFFHHAIAV